MEINELIGVVDGEAEQVGPIAVRVKARFEALPEGQHTVEAWAKLFFQETLRECANFLAKAVVDEYMRQPRVLFQARHRLMRQIARRYRI